MQKPVVSILPLNQIGVSVVIGTVQKEFSMDRSLDDAWENSIKRFFKNLSITQNTL